MIDQYIQPIQCDKCDRILGYAPYFRTDYRCIACNGVPKDDDDEPCGAAIESEGKK